MLHLTLSKKANKCISQNVKLFPEVWNPTGSYFEAGFVSPINIFKTHPGCLLLLLSLTFGSLCKLMLKFAIHSSIFPLPLQLQQYSQTWSAVLFPHWEQSGQHLFYLSHLTDCQNHSLANWKISLSSAHNWVLSLHHAVENAVLTWIRVPLG